MIQLSINKWKKVLILFAFLCLSAFVWQILRDDNAVHEQNLWKSIPHLNDIPLLIWWTPIMEDYTTTRLCDTSFCKFTSRREHLKDAKALLFYGSDIKIDDFPLPREPHHLWAVMHEESPRNVPYMPHDEWLQHFNFTSTFSRYSNLPMTTYYLPNAENLTSPTYLMPIGEKTLHQNDLGLVFFMQSNCDTMSGRDAYVKELMNHIKVDSYGACLKNKDLPKSVLRLQDDFLNHLYAPEILKLMARYKFILAYENGVCNDYISEKLWRPLIVGSIPLYYGSPTVKDWSPNYDNSYIDLRNFSSPKKLAEYLKSLDMNDTAYNYYLQHKYNMVNPIRNQELINVLKNRKVSFLNGDQFQSFECAVCSFINEQMTKKTGEITTTLTATSMHYKCPIEPEYPHMTQKVTNDADWRSIMSVGRCKAIVLKKLFKLNKNYTKVEFMQMLTKDFQMDKC